MKNIKKRFSFLRLYLKKEKNRVQTCLVKNRFNTCMRMIFKFTFSVTKCLEKNFILHFRFIFTRRMTSCRLFSLV